MIGIGIDTGGTYTDAVLYDMDTREILGSGKSLTTKNNLEIGIAAALDTLPQETLKRAELLALSTTLATNACVENKGARAKLLMLGFDWSMIDHLKDIYESYGFHDMKDFLVMDAKVENLFPDAFDPDWEMLASKTEEWFSEADAVGIVQKHPRANGARFEKTARKLLQEHLAVPITIASDISDEVDILKCSAGTMLNARLIPLLAEFIMAVKNVLNHRDLHIPIAIVRSDGSLMSELMTRECPVETLLSGPAASVIGGSTLADESDGIIVDMGGTTTDIAIVRNREPVMANKGIRIGQWKTMVKGLYVDTFGLGGDSAVRYKDGELYLDTVRVIPISVLASQYDYVLPKLEGLNRQRRASSRMLHEFFVLIRDIEGKSGYDELEHRICQALKDGPMITQDLAAAVDLDPYFLNPARLLEQGILMKSGLTPTDMMVIKGEFNIYDPAAAQMAIECLVRNLRMKPEDVPNHVYRMVEKKMYMNLARILIGQQYPGRKGEMDPVVRDQFLGWCYEQAEARVTWEDEQESKDKETEDNIIPCDDDSEEYVRDREVKRDAGMTKQMACESKDQPNPADYDFRLNLSTHMPLIGVGAPIHIFLPKVARLLGTRAVIPEYAGVANALGAIASRIIIRVTVRIKAEYKFGVSEGYSLFLDGKRHVFKHLEDAVEVAQKAAYEQVIEKARKAGTSSDPEIVLNVENITCEPNGKGSLYETLVTAVATDHFHPEG